MPAPEAAVEVRIGNLVVKPVQGWRDCVAQVIYDDGRHAVGEAALWSVYSALLAEEKDSI